MTYEEAIKTIRRCHLPEGVKPDCADLYAMELAISALERCKEIDDAEELNEYNSCAPSIYCWGWNDCLAWAKGEAE